MFLCIFWNDDMKQKHTLLIRFGIFLFVILVGLGMGWAWWKEGTRAVDTTDTTPEMFVIAQGEGVREISSRLSEQHLIRNPIAFFLLVKFLNIDNDLQAGDFRLNRAMNAQMVAKELTHGMVDVWVTTLEGWRTEEIAAKLTKELDIPASEFLRYAKEGYMFPDTYLIPQTATPAAIARLFLDTFNKKVTEQMRADALKTGLSFNQVIILASIVEREGVNDSDRPVIAGILLKRLKASWPLQADATLQYILGYQVNQKTWWKKGVDASDKLINSPFNTYKNPGLPPSPIANPGLASIKAVIYPTDSPYWFYLHDVQGAAHYAETIEEHNENIAKYL